MGGGGGEGTRRLLDVTPMVMFCIISSMLFYYIDEQAYIDFHFIFSLNSKSSVILEMFPLALVKS